MLERFYNFVTYPLVQLGIAILTTWFFTWIYYKRAGDELRVEARTLRTTTSLILGFLENRGHNITVQRSASGEPVGLIVDISGVSSSTSYAYGNLDKGDGNA